MDKMQELEWLKAQSIVISEDLIAAAKQQLQFLAAVDRRRCLYDGPILKRAINRYKSCWLPLLAKHTKSGVLEVPLVVPLDCEWIWHCHRLNPVQYKKDCEELYGRILNNKNVISTLEEKPDQRTAEVWSKLYPEEPFELDYSSSYTDRNADSDNSVVSVESIKYDMVSAVRRQCSFYYQVARPSMNDDRFLEGALARYKGFLHLIKTNKEKSIKRFCVPTYDIDLMWHSHQLRPTSYCKDMVQVLGRILEHDDTDSDRTKGQKLDVGFSETTKQWEETFGLRYWRAGAMYRGSTPSPMSCVPINYATEDAIPCGKYQQFLQLPQTKVVEVLLEIVEIRNSPISHKGDLYVTFSKKQPDIFFDGSLKLSILSESGQKQIAAFQCEPTGELVLALMCNSTSGLPISKPVNTIGVASISLHDLVDCSSTLSIDKWCELKLGSGSLEPKPIFLHIAASSTVPVLAPYELYMVKSHPFSIKTCFLPLPQKVQWMRHWTRFVDDNGNDIVNIYMRKLKNHDIRKNSVSKEVVGITRMSGKTHVLAEFTENKWSLLDSSLFLLTEKKFNKDDSIFELRGGIHMKLFHGKKLDFELKNCMKRDEHGFITVVGLSAQDPYGKAVALLNLKSGFLKVNEEWFVLPGILLTFILSDMVKREGYDVLIPRREEDTEVVAPEEKDADGCDTEDTTWRFYPIPAVGGEAAAKTMTTVALAPEKGGGCGSGCGSSCGGGCRNVVKGGGCGGGACGSGCGNVVKGSGCGGGACGSGCGNVVKGSGCGGGCGGGCGDGSYGCGGCGGGKCGGVGGCGHMVQGVGCGGGKCSGGGCGGGGADDYATVAVGA